MILLFNVTLTTLLAYNTSVYTDEVFDSPQYLEIGSKGVLNCFFNVSFIVGWWNTTTPPEFLAVIGYVTDDGRLAKSYYPGEYDMYSNGSFIINNVSIEHERTYIAGQWDSLTEISSVYEVNVSTTAKPDVGHPVVDQCKSNETSCFVGVDRTTTLRCLVRNTRPAVDLEWYMPKAHEKYVQSSTNYTDDGITYTSETNITDFLDDSSLFSFLVCKGYSQPPLLQQNEVFVLTENMNAPVEVQSVQKRFERCSKAILSCSQTIGDFIVWKKSENLTDDYDVLAFAAFNISKSYSEEYKLDSNGSLIIHSAKEQNEGFYQCTFQKDVTMIKRLFHVTVHDAPSDQSERGLSPWLLCVVIAIAVVFSIVTFFLGFMYTRLRSRGQRLVEQQEDYTEDHHD